MSSSSLVCRQKSFYGSLDFKDIEGSGWAGFEEAECHLAELRALLMG